MNVQLCSQRRINVFVEMLCTAVILYVIIVSEERARFMNLNIGPLGGGMRFINCYLQTDVVSGCLFKTHQNVWLVVTL